MKKASRASKERVRRLLETYYEKQQRLSRMEHDETLREWRDDYIVRVESGGLKGIDPSSYVGQTMASIQEKLLLERETVLEIVEELRVEVEFTKLLLYRLNEKDARLVRLKYLEQRPVTEILGLTFLSKSTYYRRQDRILNQLGLFYEEFLAKTGHEDMG